MADHTLTHSFHSRSRSSPSQLLGGNGNEYQQFQDTLPVDDTMVLDSPVVETQLEKLDFATQVVDDFDSLEDVKLKSIFVYEKEVVLDSEDEDVCRNKTVRIPNGLLDVNTLNLQNRAATCADQQRSPGNKGCGVKVERNDEQNDVPRLFTCNIGSEESEKSSQANALEFVDQFLSFNKMEFSSGPDIKKVVRKKSPPVSSAKGPQILAEKMKIRASPITKIGTFEWADTDQPIKHDVFSKRTKNPFELGGFRQRSVMRHQNSRYLNTKGGRSSGKDHEKKKEILNLHKEITGSNHSDSRFVEHTPKESCRIEQVSKLTVENSVKGFNEDMHAESSEHELDAPDIFDVGFNTQIAAEAMEALSYGPSAGCIAFDAYQGPLNITENSLKGITTRKANSEHTSLPKSDCCDLGCTGRKSTPRKRTARKSCKKSSNQELKSELAITKKLKKRKSFIREQFNCRHTAYTESSRRRPKLMVQRQESGNVGRKNECENYLGFATSVERISLSKEQAEGELKSSSAVGQETRQSLAGDTLKGTNDQLDNPGERTDDGILKYRRKRSRLVADSTKVESGRERSSDSSAEAGDSKLSRKEQTTLTGCLNLDTWSHPKGKRALRKVQSRAKGNNIFAPFTTVNGNVGESFCIRSRKTTEDSDETSCYNTDTKALFPRECDRIKTFMQSCKVNDIDCVFSNGVEKNHKFRVSPNKNLEHPVSGYPTTTRTKRMNATSSNYVSSNYHKRPFNKNLPKSSLLKELIKLGVPESIPDFTWKDLRRRRDMAYVRVLFSQHLDDNIIKQQKKISARLGISIAICPMDATHFIADRFVRTRNMLEAIALGKPVVTHLWLESCGQASCLIDEKNYILRDAKKEKEFGFSMPVSVARARQHPLLEGQSVFITPNIKPPEEMITSLVKAVHGQVVEASQMSAAKVQDNLLILSCEEDHAICVPLIEKGIAAYSSELLLSGIVIQKLQFQRHKLFNNQAKRNQTSTGFRKDMSA